MVFSLLFLLNRFKKSRLSQVNQIRQLDFKQLTNWVNKINKINQLHPFSTTTNQIKTLHQQINSTTTHSTKTLRTIFSQVSIKFQKVKWLSPKAVQIIKINPNLLLSLHLCINRERIKFLKWVINNSKKNNNCSNLFPTLENNKITKKQYVLFYLSSFNWYWQNDCCIYSQSDQKRTCECYLSDRKSLGKTCHSSWQIQLK